MASEESSSGKIKENPPTKFVQAPSSHLMCPVCGNLYADPVINIKCGHTFCRNCAFTCTHCPVDNSHCDTNQIVVNRLVVGQIEDLQIYCQHGLAKSKSKEGEWDLVPGLCSKVINYGQRNDHEQSCPYALVPCPNSDQCGSVRRRDFDRHTRLECVQVSCPFSKKGCNFCNTQQKVTEHSKLCAFREGGNTNGQLAQKVQAHEVIIQNLQSENVLLAKRVTELEQVERHMSSQLEKQASCMNEMQKQLASLITRMEHFNTPQPKRPASLSQLPSIDSVGHFSNYNSSSSSRSNSARPPSPGKNYERWEMPFQFKCIGTLRGHKDVVWSLTTKKGLLYSGGGDGIIKIWSIEQLAKGCVDNISAHKGVVHCLATWGNTLISAGADKTIRLWDLETNKEKEATCFVNAHDNIICSMIVHGDLLFTSSFSHIKVWDLKTLEEKATLTGMNHWVRALALSHGKDKLYSGSHNAINVWDTKSLQKLGSIEHKAGSIHSLAVSKIYIIAGNAGTYNQNIEVYNAETHDFVMNLCGHIGTVTTLVISPSGRFLFSASHDSNIQMWGLEKLLPIQTLSRHQGSVNTLILHGDFLLSGSEDREIKVFRYFQIQ